jgi:hypothetical protein
MSWEGIASWYKAVAVERSATAPREPLLESVDKLTCMWRAFLRLRSGLFSGGRGNEVNVLCPRQLGLPN